MSLEALLRTDTPLPICTRASGNQELNMIVAIRLRIREKPCQATGGRQFPIESVGKILGGVGCQ